MATERNVTVDLGGGDSIVVVAEQVGGTLVADSEIEARLDSIVESIHKMSAAVLEAAKRSKPKRAEVELTFGLAVEAGVLVALLGKAKGEASIRILLGWDSQD
jgi:hypothetical protein